MSLAISQASASPFSLCLKKKERKKELREEKKEEKEKG